MATPVALNRLLSRLDTSLSDARLQRSQYERNRIAANIEHARALLLTLEKQTSTVRVQSQRQAAQADLQAKRDWIRQLNTRLLELSASAQDDDDDGEEDGVFDDDDDDNGNNGNTKGRKREDILNKYAPAVQTEAGLETGSSFSTQDPGTEHNSNNSSTQQQLRSRKQPDSLRPSDNRTLASTTAREHLFSTNNNTTSRQQPNSPSNPSSLPQTESMLSHHRTEQETLTQGLLGLAQALKASSQQFGAALESEKDVLKRAEGGLDQNARGMEAAEKKMGTLRRMSEGQGWWGRIKLYGFIFALWVACFLLVFVGPKLRF